MRNYMNFKNYVNWLKYFVEMVYIEQVCARTADEDISKPLLHTGLVDKRRALEEQF